MEKVKSRGGGQNQVMTTWAFRDGEQVLVSLMVNENPKSLVLRIANKITAEEWSCQYDLKYIEDLTQRTGNYKSFEVFIAMIKSALLKSTDSVELDLMTYEDLKALRNKRFKNGARFGGSDVLGGNDGDQNNNSNVSGAVTKRKYLIITYVAEFDSVHYPLPLAQSGAADPLIMQNNIKKLQSEVTHYRNSNQEMAGRLRELEEVGNGQASCSPGEPEIQALLAAIRRLEQKSASERMEHLKEMETLLNENNHLRDQISELQLSEEELNTQITRLERMATTRNLRAALPSTSRDFLVRNGRREHPPRRRDFSNENKGSRSRSRPNSQFGGERLNVAPQSGSGGQKFNFVRNRSRTVSPAPLPKFDPTWYVREKKGRQEEIARMRLSQIKSGMPRPNFSGISTPVGSEGAQSPRVAQGRAPTYHTELRLAARRERSLSRDRELPPLAPGHKSTNRGKSIERQGQGLLKKQVEGKTGTVKTAGGANMKSTKVGNEKGMKKTGTKVSTFETKGKKSAKEFEGSLEALQAYIEDTNQKLSAYKHFGNVFSPAN